MIVFVSVTVEHSDEIVTKIPKELSRKVLLLFNASQAQRRDCYVNEYLNKSSPSLKTEIVEFIRSEKSRSRESISLFNYFGTFLVCLTV